MTSAKKRTQVAQTAPEEREEASARALVSRPNVIEEIYFVKINGNNNILQDKALSELTDGKKSKKPNGRPSDEANAQGERERAVKDCRACFVAQLLCGCRPRRAGLSRSLAFRAHTRNE